MLVVYVHVRVRPEDLEAFLAETRRNAAASLQEPGIRRFDVLNDQGDAGHVVLTRCMSTSQRPTRTSRRPTMRAGAGRSPE